MPATPTPRPFHTRTAPACIAVALLLAACGGGGGGGAAPTAPAPTPITTTPPVPTVPSQLSGVAAFGAPLAGATLKIIDAKGKAVGTGTTNQADGSYTLVLNTATPTLPLMVQAAGFDSTGQPLLLHSAVPTLTGNAVVNVTPLTDAIVALTLGAEPRKVFAQPANHATALAALAKLTPASDFVKTLVKVNLSDAKAGTLSTLDLFGDSSFAATKAGVDLALETLSISMGLSSARRDQLQLANKLGNKPVEVTVDLANAATELAKTTGATPASAITSTLKATTSPTTVVTRLAALDTLAVTINSVIAAGGTGSAATALTSAYVRHNGRDASALAALIAGWAQQGTQLGRLQVTGCADTPSTTTTTTTTTTTAATCTRVAVAARLNDTSGREAGSFTDVVSYSTSTLRWSLVGNGQPAELAVRAVAWLALNADGTRQTEHTPNPTTGIQLLAQSTAGTVAVLTPSNYVLSLVPCNLSWLCITPTPGSTSTVATGMPTDQDVFQGSSAWMGLADSTAGAIYGYTSTSDQGTVTSTPVTLRSAFMDTPADSRFPVLDGVKAGDAISGAGLISGTTLAWQTWAAANPDMRVTVVRLVLSDTTPGNAPLVFEARPARWQASSLEWAAVTVPDDFPLGAVTLWLVAIDNAGREHNTGYTVVQAP